MYLFMPHRIEHGEQNVYEEMASITLLSIPLFILKGAAIGKSRAGQDLYAPCTYGWGASRRPGHCQCVCLRAVCGHGGLQPATCSAIGSAGIPEMRKRGYSPALRPHHRGGRHLGYPAAAVVTMILYAVAAEQSLGRLFLAGIFPGILLVFLFAAYAVVRYRKEYRLAEAEFKQTGKASALLSEETFTTRQKFEMLPRVVPFVLLLLG